MNNIYFYNIQTITKVDGNKGVFWWKEIKKDNNYIIVKRKTLSIVPSEWIIRAKRESSNKI